MRDYESLNDRFSFDRNGNFEHSEDVQTAIDDGALEPYGSLFKDYDTGDVYDKDGNRY